MPAAAASRAVESFDDLALRRAQRGDERAWCDLIARFWPVDAVIGDASSTGLTRGTLEEMHKRWFEK